MRGNCVAPTVLPNVKSLPELNTKGPVGELFKIAILARGMPINVPVALGPNLFIPNSAFPELRKRMVAAPVASKALTSMSAFPEDFSICNLNKGAVVPIPILVPLSKS